MTLSHSNPLVAARGLGLGTDPSNDKSFKTQCLASTIQHDLVVSKEDSFDFRKRGITEMFNAVKFLFSYSFYEERLLNEKQSYVFMGLLDSLLSVRDHDWNKAHRKQLLEIADQWTLMTNLDSHPRRTIYPFLRIVEWKLKEKILRSHEYYGRKKFWALSRWLIPINRRTKRPPPPQAYVGVGYKDKGNKRDTAMDGSPSWQLVASQQLNEKGVYLERLPGVKTHLEVYSLYLKRRVSYPLQ